jgi:hypothetical protein
MKLLCRLLLALFGGFVATVSQAGAGTLVYTSPAAFAAATVNPILIGFNAIAVPFDPGFVGFPTPPGLTVGSVNFSTPNPAVNVNVNLADYYGIYFSDPQADYADQYIVNSGNPGNNELDITFPATRAVAVDWDAFSGGNDTIFTLSNGFSDTITDSPPIGAPPSFLGFTSSVPITSLSLVTQNDAWVVVDLTLAGVPVPEPASLTLLGASLLALAFSRRCRGYLSR